MIATRIKMIFVLLLSLQIFMGLVWGYKFTQMNGDENSDGSPLEARLDILLEAAREAGFVINQLI